MAPTENEALSAIQSAALLAVENADRASARLRVLARRIDTAWTAQTPKKRQEAIESAHAYYVDTLAALEAAVSQLRSAPVLSADAHLASGQCAPEPEPKQT